MRTFKKCVDALMKATYYVEGVLTFVFFVIVFINVIMRTVHSSLVWAEQICRYMFAWATCLGIPIVLRRRGHVGFDLLYKKGGKAVKIIVDIIIDAAAALFAFWMVKYGIEYLAHSAGKLLDGSVRLPYFALYGVEPISGIMILIILVEHLMTMFIPKYAEIMKEDK